MTGQGAVDAALFLAALQRRVDLAEAELEAAPDDLHAQSVASMMRHEARGRVRTGTRGLPLVACRCAWCQPAQRGTGRQWPNVELSTECPHYVGCEHDR
jgi:hypothetical protein